MLKEIRYLESLEQQLNELEKQIKAYDKYIQSNVDENEEFGKSWFPVCFDEFVDNEWNEYLDYLKNNEELSFYRIKSSDW